MRMMDWWSPVTQGGFSLYLVRTNVRKTMGMVNNPFWSTGVRLDEAYTLRIKGEVQSFKERQQERVLLPECRKELVKESLVAHRQTQHSVVKGG